MLCIEIGRRVSKFMYKKSQANIEHLSDAMRHTRKVMSTIHGSEKTVLSPVTDAMLGNNNNNESQQTQRRETERLTTARSELSRNSVDDGDRQHEQVVHVNRQLNNNALSLKLPQFLPTDDDFPSISDISSNTAVDSLNPAEASRQQTNFINANFTKASKKVTTLLSSITSPPASPTNHTNTKPTARPSLSRHYTTDASVKRFESQHIRHKITSLQEGDVDREWNKHEQQIHEYFAARDKINERMELIAVAEGRIESTLEGTEAEIVGTDSQANAVMVRISFESYWKSHCDALGNVTVILFYLGTSAMLVATMTFMYTLFTVTYANNIGAYVGVSTIGLSLLVCLCLAVYLRLFDERITNLRTSIETEAVNNKRTFMTRLHSLLSRNSSDSSNSTSQTPATTNSHERPPHRSDSSNNRHQREASLRPNFYNSHNHTHHSQSQRRGGPVHSLSDGDEPSVRHDPGSGLPYPNSRGGSRSGGERGRKGKKTK